MSIQGGFVRAIQRAEAVDATALQIFVKTARQWSAPPIDQASACRFRAELERSGLGQATAAHASYLINLASPDAALQKKSEAALADELDRCELLAIPYLVLHPGAHLGSGLDEGLERVARAIDRVLGARRGVSRRTQLLLEVTAGQGSCLGRGFEELGRICRSCGESAQLGVCFDTCHAFAAGYDFREARGYRAMFDEFDAAIGLRRLRVIHLNDSVGTLGQRLDRHAHIGEGQIGLPAFRRLLRDPRLALLPMVLETPKGDDLAEDRRNLELLRRLLPRGRR